MKTIRDVPDYPDVKFYANGIAGGMRVWEADPWKETSLSWKESCYIHAGISQADMIFEGEDAQKLLSIASINDVFKWKTGFSKHLVQCDKNGLIANHGLMIRDGEKRFRMTACNPAPVLAQIKPDMKVNFYTKNTFIHQFAGPKEPLNNNLPV